MRTFVATIALSATLLTGVFAALHGRADAATTAPDAPKTCPTGQELVCVEQPGECKTPSWGSKRDCVLLPPKTVCFCVTPL